MSNELTSPLTAALLDQVRQGGQNQVVVVVQQPQPQPEEEKSLLHSSFRQTTRWVFKPVGQVVKWSSVPYWGPVGLGVREIVETPKRLITALVEPWKEEATWHAEEHRIWAAATPEERAAIRAQAYTWVPILVAGTWLTILVPVGWKLLPLLGIIGLGLIRQVWCPVRHTLGLQQGGLAAVRNLLGVLREIPKQALVRTFETERRAFGWGQATPETPTEAT